MWSFEYKKEEPPNEDSAIIQKCEYFKVDFKKFFQKDTCFYKLTITNNDTISPENLRPKSFSIEIKKDSIINISGGATKGWDRKPCKIYFSCYRSKMER